MTTRCGLSSPQTKTSARRSGVSQSTASASPTVASLLTSTSRSRPPKRSRKYAKNLALTVMGTTRWEKALVQAPAGLRVPDVEDDGDERREERGELPEDVLADDGQECSPRLPERVPEGRPEAAAAKLERSDLVDDEKPGRPGLADDRPGPLERRRDEDVGACPLRPGPALSPEIGLTAARRYLDEVVAGLARRVRYGGAEEPGAGEAPGRPERQGAFEERRLARVDRAGQDEDHRP